MIPRLMSIEQRFINIERQIHQWAAQRCLSSSTHMSNTCSDSVQLLAVSKGQSVEKMRSVWALGQRAFGENYVQEALDKMEQLRSLEGIKWHFIGRIQSNKIKWIARHFDWVHTLSSLKAAQKLHEYHIASERCAPLNVCIQVNISDESTKAGIACEHLWEFIDTLLAQTQLCLRGLMVIPARMPVASDEAVQALRANFQKAYLFYEEMKRRWPMQLIDTLSMGMSSDLRWAIEEGSTLVRVGTALFGER